MGEIAHIPIKGALRSNSFHENKTIYNLPPFGLIGGINIYELFFRERVNVGPSNEPRADIRRK
jgi:hypothetical protein